MNFKIENIIRASWLAVIGNTFLSVLKIVAGLISGSLAVLADGIDSASDIVTSLITLFTARIMRKPPSPEYPYGYLKADTVATKALAFVILFAGAQLAISTIHGFLEGKERELPSMLAIYVTLISIAGKILLSLHQFRKGKQTNSEMLKANARNMQNDVFISIAVLTGLFFTFILKMPIFDTVTALAVSIWIIKVGIQIFMQTNRDLMDGVSDRGLYKKVFEAIDKVDGANNPHRLRIRKIGNYLMIAFDIEVDGAISAREAHIIACKAEKAIRSEVDNIFDIMIHIEPVGGCEEEENYGVRKSDFPD
ncbi:MAG: cation transporter [Bacteroidales bacterium]|nr:cation transporter [Bacteroidales bacterium]